MAHAQPRTYATGKRKTAVARVWISPGTGQMTVNTNSADSYFERETSRMIARQALELIEALDQFDVIAGKRDVLAGKIQETYGVTRDDAERQVRDWETSLRDEDFGGSAGVTRDPPRRSN